MTVSIENTKEFCKRFTKRVSRNKILVFLFLSAPIIVFLIPMLLTGNKIGVGDADYLTQGFEAARTSILKYHQFPWWNPWVSGGVPLFANPQYGLFSIVTPLTLIFGSVFGYKLALLIYMLIGFWGLFFVFNRRLKTPLITALLLAYIWTFSTFFSNRIGGHFTFFVIQIFPWVLYFFLGRKKDRLAWLKFGIAVSVMALAAAHNITIMSYAVLALFYILSSFFLRISRDSFSAGFNIVKDDLLFFAKSGAVFLILSSYRLIFTYQYTSDFPRPQLWQEDTIGIAKAIFAVFGPIRQFGANTPSLPQWSWMEVGVYIGLTTGIAGLLVLFQFFKKRKNTSSVFTLSPMVIIAMLLIFFVLGLGKIIGDASPYLLLQKLPLFSSMRVATRWLVWFSLFYLIFIAAYKGNKFRKAINVLLLVSAIQLFIISMPRYSAPFVLTNKQFRPGDSEFQQKRHFNTEREGIKYDENFTEATINNYGQIIAGDSLVDTRWEPPFGVNTIRCSYDEGCPFVLSKNATVMSWSPNKIILSRTNDQMQPVELNMNPGSCWTANGKYLFIGDKVANPSGRFIVTDRSEILEITCVPRLSIEWLSNKIF